MEEAIIKNCAPVLGGLKTGGLFCCRKNENTLKYQVDDLNRKLSKKGVSVFILKTTPDFSLVYVCRKTKLEKDTEGSEVRSFLRKIGYVSFTFEALLETLFHRFSQDLTFPHEIGLFLGYPLEDVIGFIKNKGNNFKICGYWKVYNDEKYAEILFGRFSKCTEVYTRLFLSGSKRIEQLTVSV